MAPAFPGVRDNRRSTVRLGSAICIALAVSFCAIPAFPVLGEPGNIITALPFTATQPGTYILDRDLIAPAGSEALTISADNVTIDLRGHTISTDNKSSTKPANGITVQNRSNVIIRNGKVENFKCGIYLPASKKGDRVVRNARNGIKNMQIQGCLYAGIKLDYASACTVEDCAIVRTGGAFISDVSCGIIMLAGDSNRFVRNRISGVYSRSGPVAFGFYGTGKRPLISQNQFVRCPYGISLPKDSAPRLEQNRFISVGHKIDLW
jgi:nitrous oxidase accessory protein NosD